MKNKLAQGPSGATGGFETDNVTVRQTESVFVDFLSTLEEQLRGSSERITQDTQSLISNVVDGLDAMQGIVNTVRSEAEQAGIAGPQINFENLAPTIKELFGAQLSQRMVSGQDTGALSVNTMVENTLQRVNALIGDSGRQVTATELISHLDIGGEMGVRTDESIQRLTEQIEALLGNARVLQEEGAGTAQIEALLGDARVLQNRRTGLERGPRGPQMDVEYGVLSQQRRAVEAQMATMPVGSEQYQRSQRESQILKQQQTDLLNDPQVRQQVLGNVQGGQAAQDAVEAALRRFREGSSDILGRSGVVSERQIGNARTVGMMPSTRMSNELAQQIADIEEPTQRERRYPITTLPVFVN